MDWISQHVFLILNKKKEQSDCDFIIKLAGYFSYCNDSKITNIVSVTCEMDSNFRIAKSVQCNAKSRCDQWFHHFRKGTVLLGCLYQN